MIKETLNNRRTKIVLGVILACLIIFWVIYAFQKNFSGVIERTESGYPVEKDKIYDVPASKQTKALEMAKLNNWKDLVLFTTNLECPACRTIEAFITEKNNANLKIDKVNCYEPKDNMKEINEISDLCQISLKDSGVPVLYDSVNSVCYTNVDSIEQAINSKVAK